MKHFLYPAILGLVLASCSSQDAPNPTPDTDANGNRYMAINIVATSSRAETYDDGEADESQVLDESYVEFLFFDNDGNAFDVSTTSGSSTNIVKGTSIKDVTEEDHANATNITAKKLVVVLSSRQDGTVPSQVVAVLNNTGEALSGMVSLADLKAKTVEACSKSVTVDKADKTIFMMSNSVYNNGTSDVYATPIEPGNITTTADAAAKNPVNIYVERLAAKISYGTEFTKVFTLTGTPSKLADGTTDVGTVYAKIVGWGVYNTAKTGTVLKDITGYTPTTTWTWNSAEDHRSFWALVKTTLGIGNDKVKYSDMAAAHTASSSGLAKYAYVLENTFPTSVTASDNTVTTYDNNTGVVFAAELYSDQDCKNTLDIAKWLSKYYTTASLKTAIAGYLAKQLYKYTAPDDTEGSKGTWTSISADDILFDVTDGYKVLPALAKNDGAYTSNWYEKDSTTPLTKEQIDKILQAVPKAEIWNKGKCYYFTTIKHPQTTSSSVPAVVRNHWYKVTVNSIDGLGTPVYDPDESYAPTIPEGDDSWYLDAQINVLAWRIITNSVDLKSN